MRSVSVVAADAESTTTTAVIAVVDSLDDNNIQRH